MIKAKACTIESYKNMSIVPFFVQSGTNSLVMRLSPLQPKIGHTWSRQGDQFVCTLWMATGKSLLKA